ncbi:aminopeptidase C [Xylanibacter ruminicola]|uniref:Aminopeptidase n=1 Tax=Xylanibacter ruminicola TaxID=839 RepID=A0A1M6WNY5_XYLRU|nr:C1 family peptidase [Xylanibacter ruminicola]SHK95309.1 Aminopeptidase C [Xylanibacter ruminicola]
MKKIFTLALVAMVALSASAAKKKGAEKNANKPVFTTIKENPITSIKDQNRSGTCWNYSTLSFFEAEVLKATGKTYNFDESFVENKTYMDRAIQVVRYHGDCQFAQGGSSEDVLATMKTHGIIPEGIMPFAGSLYGDSLNNFNEFFSLLEPYVAAVAKSDSKKLSTQWKVGFQGILDAYLGKCPEKFTFEGKEYTPKSFMASLGINLDDYVSITSYTHHPFYTTFAVEVQDNWRFPQSYNVPMDEMMRIIDNAIDNGYTVAWGGDVSEPGFTRDGLAYAIDNKAAVSLTGSDMAKWLRLEPAKKANVIDSLGCTVPEIVATQQLRQERFDNWELTDDHGMLIYGVAKDQKGKEYYMVKNSWGETGKYKGIWYMTKTYIAANTMDFLINKNAIPADIRKKLGI